MACSLRPLPLPWRLPSCFFVIPFFTGFAGTLTGLLFFGAGFVFVFLTTTFAGAAFLTVLAGTAFTGFAACLAFATFFGAALATFFATGLATFLPLLATAFTTFLGAGLVDFLGAGFEAFFVGLVTFLATGFEAFFFVTGLATFLLLLTAAFTAFLGAGLVDFLGAGFAAFFVGLATFLAADFLAMAFPCLEIDRKYRLFGPSIGRSSKRQRARIRKLIHQDLLHLRSGQCFR